MFEKEAEEYIKVNNLEWELECHRTSPLGEVEQAFLKGAEFGYNKANEWHYVKDGKLPKYNEYVLIYTDLKNTYEARIPTEKDYFVTRRGGFVQTSAVIAWQEIVLPELKDC